MNLFYLNNILYYDNSPICIDRLLLYISILIYLLFSNLISNPFQNEKYNNKDFNTISSYIN